MPLDLFVKVVNVKEFTVQWDWMIAPDPRFLFLLWQIMWSRVGDPHLSLYRSHTHTNTDQPVSTKQQSVYLAPVSQCPISQTAVLYRTYTHIPVFVVFTGNTDHQWSDRGGLIASQRDQGVSSYERHVHPTHIRKKACSIDHGPIVRWVTLHLFAFMCCDF